MLDLNYATLDETGERVAPSAATDWRAIDPTAYVDWQLAQGANVLACQAWTFGGYATFPSELGPRAMGAAADLFPAVYEAARSRGIPVQTYLNVGADLAVCMSRPHWVVPGSHGVEVLGDVFPHGFLAPESAWSDLVVERIEELLSRFPVDWLLCDWFCYGTLTNDLPLASTPDIRAAFASIMGRPLPDDPHAVSAGDALTYKREVLARFFRRIRDAVRATSPATRLLFNVPYFRPADPMWVDHPMLAESDALFAESSNPEIVDWLLAIRRPEQRVMTTIYGRPDDLVEGRRIQWSDPAGWRHWSDRGCDLVAWAFPVPPSATPHPKDGKAIELITSAYRDLAAETAART